MDDRYAKFDYSRLISWEDRLRREWPFFEEVFQSAPVRRILDLGSGTGEHARLFASHGFDVTGIDGSEAMIEKARVTTSDDRVRFVPGTMLESDSLAGNGFGGAICVGNALPHLTGPGDLDTLAASLRRAIAEGGSVIIQMLNYERFAAKNERALPLSFLPDPDVPEAKMLFLRTMELHDDRRVTFMPTLLRIRSDREEPVELLMSQRVEIRGWYAADLEAAFSKAGFATNVTYGSYQKAPFDPTESRDVIFVAR